MKVKSVVFVSVGAVLLAASAAVSGVAAAENKHLKLASHGYNLLTSGKATAAIVPLSEAIESKKLMPDVQANAYLNRALAFQRLSQHREAVDDYTAAIRLEVLSDELKAIALYNRGLAHHKLENHALAIEDFTDALFLKVDLAQAYYSRGNVLRDAGQYLFALSDYEKALKYDHPKPHFAHFGMALTFDKLRRSKHAQKSLVEALKVDPDFVPAQVKLAELTRAEDNKKKPNQPAQGERSAGLDNDFVFSGFQEQGADDIVTASTGKPRAADLSLSKPDLPKAVAPNFAPSPAAAPAEAEVAEKPQGTDQVAEINLPPDNKNAGPINLVAGGSQAKVIQASLPDPIDADSAKSPMSGWTVQLSSQRAEDSAWKVWSKLKRKHHRLLATSSPVVVKADLGKRGVFYRLRVHEIDERRVASRLCKKLKRKGTGCFVQHADG